MANDNQQDEKLNYVADVYKIFIFESNTGELLKTEEYVNFPDVQKEILDYNKDNQDNRKNLFIGVEFPPKGVKFDFTIKQFVDKTLSEKVADGEVQMPSNFKIVNNVFVRLTKRELLEKGLISIEFDEKIDEFDNIVKLSKKELYDSNKITKYQVYEYFVQELNLKVEDSLKSFYNYPMHEMGTWQLKSKQSADWLNLATEQKNEYLNEVKILGFDLIISEANVSEKDSNEQKIEKIDLLANKVVIKYKDLEKKYGETFASKTAKKNQLKDTLDTNDVDVYNKMEKIISEMVL